MKLNRLFKISALAASLAFIATAVPNATADHHEKSGKSYTSGKDIVALAAGDDNFKTLVAAVKAAGLVETLQGKGPFTVFAPTDAAFAKLPKGTVEDLLKPENKAKLVSILTYHVVPGKVMASDVKTMEAKTVQGQQVSLNVSDAGVTINDAKIVKTDLVANNGVIHVIDTVILPKS